MTRLKRTKIPDCFELLVEPFQDARGTFVKPFQSSALDEHKLSLTFRENFYTRSKAGVIRGMHFQTPPYELTKLVTCVAGSVWDVVVDLREGSPTFGQHLGLELSGAKANGILVPPGCAHGFLTIDDDSIISYLTTSEYRAENDAGIHWQSAGIEWPFKGDQPIVSARDDALPPLEAFDTPFTSSK